MWAADQFRGCRDQWNNQTWHITRLCGHWDIQSLDVLHAWARRGWDQISDPARNHMAGFWRNLNEAKTKRYSIGEASNSPLVGAALMTLQRQSIKLVDIDTQQLASYLRTGPPR